MDNKFGFLKIKENIMAMKNQLPLVLANQAQNYFVNSWRQQGWDGVGWKEVKRRTEGTPEYKYPKSYGLGRRTSAILVSSGTPKGKSGGTLRRAVSNSIRSAQFNSIRLVVDLPYAEVINDGGEHMPKRKFFGDSPLLRVKQIGTIKQFTDKVWRK